MARLGTTNFKHPTYTPHVHAEVWKACVYKEASTGTHLESTSFADVAEEGVGRFVTTSQMAQEQFALAQQFRCKRERSECSMLELKIT
mmetsp:Transcript_62379/g.143701  ORF Transcript_62379/g.143701 Transcript_62379/m.143701 type:complete len:88 (+) Transcript_62379:25-288(+)